MKVLIADEDESSRTLLSRLLSRYMGCEVWETGDGFDALATIESVHPDVVVCDVQIPRLDGLDVVQVVRGSPAFAATTVVLTGRRATRTVLDRAIGLGVRQFLLKPIDVEDVRRRFTRILTQVPSAHVRATRFDAGSGELGPPSILLADGDPHFRRFAVPLLHGRFRVTEAANGADAMAALQSEPFDVICIGEELRLLRDSLLAGALRMLPHGSDARFFRIAEHGRLQLTPPFEAFIERSFIPGTFLRSVNRMILGEVSLVERLREMAHDELRRELLSAMQQTLGVLAALEGREAPHRAPMLEHPVRTEISLDASTPGVALSIELSIEAESARRLARAVLRKPEVDDTETRDLLLELANMVGGRMRESLMLRGLDFRLAFPSVPEGDRRERSDALACLQTDGHALLFAQLFIREDDAQSAALGDHDSFDAVLF